MKTGEVVFLVADVLLGALGWVVFAVFNDSWKSLRNTPDEKREWLFATIGLIVGIVCVALLVVFALVIGALEAKKHSKERLAKLQRSSIQVPSLR